MTSAAGTSAGQRLERLAALAGLVVVVVAGLVIVGWLFGLDALKRMRSDYVAMKLNTAICFVLCGLALRAKVSRRGLAQPARGNWLALVALGVAGVTLFEHGTGANLGIDDLLVGDLTAGRAAPGRMAPVAAAGFVLVGLSLLARHRESPRRTLFSQALALVCQAIFMVVSLGYLYGALGLYRSEGFGSVALHTALLFQVLSLGVLASQPYAGVMRPLTAELTAASAARRLLPATVVVPILLGWLRLAGQRLGLYGLEFGLALYATGNVMVLGALTWRTAAILGQAERQRNDAREALAAAERLAQTTQELHARNLRIAEANRRKTLFLAHLSHELRTPLNAIIGFATLLRGERSGALNDAQRAHVAEVLGGGNHLLGLVNDVLDLSEVEAGLVAANQQLCDVAQLARSVVDTFAEQARRRNVMLSTELAAGLASVRSDERLLRQILVNYLSNALKFTPDGGRIALRFLEEDERTFRVVVDDSGIGIKAEDLERLFVAFEQLDSGTAKRYQGTGLGLAIVKRFAETLGGRVEVSSEPGRGSRFSVVLPLDASDSRPPA